MHRPNGNLLFSASDLVGFLECEHFTSLELINLELVLEQRMTPVLLQEKGHYRGAREGWSLTAKTG